MKQLAILLVSVAILLTIWAVIGKLATEPEGPVPLIIPRDPNDKLSLLRAADQLWRAAPGYYDPLQVAALARRLVDGLEDDHWRAVAPAVLFAWEKLRGDTASRVALSAVGPKVFPRVARSGSLEDLEMLIRLSNASSFDRTEINGALENIASTPISSGEFTSSRQFEVVGAAIRAKDLTRAKEYLSKAKLADVRSGSDDRAIVRDVKDALELCESGEKGRFDFPAVTRLWKRFGSGTIERTIVRPALEGIALSLMSSFDPVLAKIPLAELFKGSVGEVGGDGYWERVLTRFLPSCALGDESKNGTMSILVSLFESRFTKSGFAFGMWMKAASGAAKAAPEDPIRPVKLYERAFAVAPADLGRLQSLKGIVAGYLRAKEFSRARKAAEQSISSIKDAECAKEAQALLDEAKKKCVADEDRVAKQEKVIEEDRHRGRLKNMKDMLVQARKVGRPDGEIRNIEKAIKDLERQLPE